MISPALREKTTAVVRILFRLFIGGIFAYAGFSKLMSHPENFQAAMAEYGMIPSFLLPVLARTIPWVEWLAGMFVLAGYQFRPSVLLLAAMSVSFCVLILVSGKLWGAGGGDCGCFGGGIHLSSRQMFFVDLFNTVNGLWLARSSKSMPWTLDRWLGQQSEN